MLIQSEPVGMLVSCTAENGDRWFREVHNLALSVRRFGGTLSDAPFVACFVDDVDARYVSELAQLDAEVTVVTRFDPRNPPSNKLRMLELVEQHDFDVLVMIDTDTLVLGDITGWATPDAVAVKPENDDPYSRACWRRVFAALGIAEPSRSLVTTSTGKLTYPYYNTGVMLVPRDRCGDLGDAWSKRVHQALELYDRRPDVVPPGQRHWTNQLAFALAVVGDGIPVTDLPVAANLSTTKKVHPLFSHQVTPPFVLHYHNEMDAQGFVFRSLNPRLNPLIDAFNRERAEVRRLPYRGLPKPPLVRRTLRRVEGEDWYRRGPIATVRRLRIMGPLRRLAKRLAQGTPG